MYACETVPMCRKYVIVFICTIGCGSGFELREAEGDKIDYGFEYKVCSVINELKSVEENEIPELNLPQRNGQYGSILQSDKKQRYL